MSESFRKLTEKEISTVFGGAVDYSSVYPVFDDIRAQFHELINAGCTPDEARRQTKSKYWNNVMDIVREYPDNCPPRSRLM